MSLNMFNSLYDTEEDIIRKCSMLKNNECVMIDVAHYDTYLVEKQSHMFVIRRVYCAFSEEYSKQATYVETVEQVVEYVLPNSD